MWIAKKEQTIKRNGAYVKVFPGDPVPEAATWPNRKSWIDGGYIKWVDRDEVPPKPVPTVDVTVIAAPKVYESSKPEPGNDELKPVKKATSKKKKRTTKKLPSKKTTRKG